MIKSNNLGCGRQCHFDGDTTDYAMCGDKFKNSDETFICYKCRNGLKGG